MTTTDRSVNETTPHGGDYVYAAPPRPLTLDIAYVESVSRALTLAGVPVLATIPLEVN